MPAQGFCEPLLGVASIKERLLSDRPNSQDVNRGDWPKVTNFCVKGLFDEPCSQLSLA